MRRLTAGLVVGLLLGLSGCGDTSDTATAAEKVPALSAGLARVDAAVAAHRYGVARRELNALITTTTNARDDGRLDAAKAESILAAAAHLLASLPVVTPAPTPTPTPKTTAPTPRDDKSDDDQHKGKGKGRGRDG